MNSLEDFILTYISEQTIIHPKDIKDKFQKKGYNMERITQAITDIDSEGLISTAQGKTESICLTREGKKAVKMGFAKYLEMKEKENDIVGKLYQYCQRCLGSGGFYIRSPNKRPISKLMGVVICNVLIKLHFRCKRNSCSSISME
mgnify:CR=1 FL=1